MFFFFSSGHRLRSLLDKGQGTIARGAELDKAILKEALKGN